MKKCYLLLFFCLIIFLVILTGCSKAECNSHSDCQKDYFEGLCVEERCEYEVIADVCGNTICEDGENKCSCETDCGSCDGSVEGSSFLEESCDTTNQCRTDIFDQIITPYTSQPIRSGGDSFTIIATYNDPFNMKKDGMDVLFYLSKASSSVKDRMIRSVELKARNPQRTTIVLASKTIRKPLFNQGKDNGFTETLRFDFPTSKIEEELSNIELEVTYDYVSISGTTEIPKTGTFKVSLRNVKLTYVVPTATYECPESCDDEDDTTTEFCDATTGYQCAYELKSGECGNFVCEEGVQENECTCPQDCGQCTGTTRYLENMCSNNVCVTRIQSGAVIATETLVDQRSLGSIDIGSTFEYSTPFNTKEDKLTIDFTLRDFEDNTSSIMIKSVRVLERGILVGEMIGEQTFNGKGSSIQSEVRINEFNDKEIKKTVSVKIEYAYTKDGEEKTGSFTKNLKTITFLSPS